MKNAILRVLVVGGALLACASATLPAVELSSAGKPSLKIHVEPADNPALQSSAKELGQYLKRITGAEFEISADPFTDAGILLVLAKGCPEIKEADQGKLAALGLEGYLLDAAAQRILIAGNSELAVQHGVFDLLESVGCRWLVPGERWTVVPSLPTLTVKDGQRFEAPDFVSRRIWYAYGMGVDASREVLRRDYDLWVRANRLGGIAGFHTGHSYPGTVGRYKEEFKKHPEFFAMKQDGKREPYNENASLCYSNPDLATIFIANRLAMLDEAKAKSPHEYMVSMDPNDGSSECYCPECAKLGNGSDQAVYLANQVARALREKYPEAKVGMYAYASHRLPPEKVKPESNLLVEIAMGFNKTQYTLEELIQLWSKQVTAVGIRDYFGVMAWDWGLPGRGKGARFDYVKKMFPRFKELGAVSFNAEINANWGSFGPATYVATKLLWKIQADADAAYADYFAKAFGKGAPGMQELYTLWDKDQRLSQGNLHGWLQKLAEVAVAAKDEPAAVQARVEDMMAYLHYVVLFRNWEMAENTKDQEKAYAALDKLLKFSWRTRERQMHHSYALQRRLVNAGAAILKPLRPGWRFNDAKAVWKDPAPLEAAEMQKLFQEDVAAFPLDTRIVQYDTAVAVLSKLPLANDHGAATKLTLRSSAQCLVAPPETSAYTFKMQGKDGSLFDHDTGALIEEFTWKNGAGDIAVKDGVARKNEEENGLEEQTENGVAGSEGTEWKLNLKQGGVYRLEFKRAAASRNGDGTIEWPADLPLAWIASEDSGLWMDGSGPFYVFVPKGTKEIICRGSPRLSLVGPDKKKRIDVMSTMYPVGEDAARIPVPDGGDNCLWAVVGMTRGEVRFLNIPPYLNCLPNKSILPKNLATAPGK